jgi:hypothetical protein
MMTKKKNEKKKKKFLLRSQNRATRQCGATCRDTWQGAHFSTEAMAARPGRRAQSERRKTREKKSDFLCHHYYFFLLWRATKAEGGREYQEYLQQTTFKDDAEKNKVEVVFVFLRLSRACPTRGRRRVPVQCVTLLLRLQFRSAPLCRGSALLPTLDATRRRHTFQRSRAALSKSRATT